MKEIISSISAIAPGFLFGVIIGIAQDNIGLWLSLGLAIGVAIDYSRNEERNPEKKGKKE